MVIFHFLLCSLFPVSLSRAALFFAFMLSFFFLLALLYFFSPHFSPALCWLHFYVAWAPSGIRSFVTEFRSRVSDVLCISFVVVTACFHFLCLFEPWTCSKSSLRPLASAAESDLTSLEFSAADCVMLRSRLRRDTYPWRLCFFD